MWGRLGRALLAVVAGSGFYYFLFPRLPHLWQHQPFAIDPGLGLLFVLCLVAYGIVQLVNRLV